MAEKLITFDNIECLAGLFGSLDENIKILEDEYSVHVIARGDTLKLRVKKRILRIVVRQLTVL